MDVLESAFHPNAVAVAGASEDPFSFGYHYVRHLLDYGYPGHIYPVNPRRETIQGLKAYPNLTSIPEPVDYVICCLPASKVLDLLAECPSRGVKVVHLLTARLSETGRQEAKDLEARILQEARRSNVRLIGPNCMGIYYPGGGISLGYGFPKEAGIVGAVFQSGGASDLLVRHGELQGLRFSKVISYGNALDLDESDFLNYLAHDDETRVIAAYFEGAKDGRKLLNALTDAARVKPVIVIKGGRGLAGTRAAASHTAALAGYNVIWETAFRKAGVIQAQDIRELVNFLVAFSFLPPIRGNRVGIFGGGGGMSVMSADICEEAGLVLPPLPAEFREKLRTKAPEIWDWVGNPVDVSIMGGISRGLEAVIGEFPEMIAESPQFDFIITEMAEDNPFPEDIWSVVVKRQTEAYINVSRKQLKPMIAVVGGGETSYDESKNMRWRALAEQRARLINAGIPTYSTIAEAARAVRQVIGYWQTREET